MRTNQWGNEFRTTVICVDSFDRGALTGRLCHPALEDGTTFSGALELLRKMDAMLNGLEFPQSFTARRSFQPPDGWTIGKSDAGSLRRGGLATFAVRIMFRRNASWQGEVTWLDSGQNESFRSVLELLLLMDSALKLQ